MHDSTPICSISEMADGQSGIVAAIKINEANSALMLKIDIDIGTMVKRNKEGFTVEGAEYRVSEEILNSILVNTGAE